MSIQKYVLHSARINNNCPECYSTEGLEFTFEQENFENRFYSKAKKEVIETLYCHNCKQQVFPVSWTEDIERVHQYHSKLAKPKSSMIKLKPLAYILILFDVITIAVIIYFLNNN
ncbi:MAG: hypothetical protein HKN48_06480 [Flavobacteriaceae bacterium]|nr:hypothetical protein [Flavobacteriaceae bacterium]